MPVLVREESYYHTDRVVFKKESSYKEKQGELKSTLCRSEKGEGKAPVGKRGKGEHLPLGNTSSGVRKGKEKTETGTHFAVKRKGERGAFSRKEP